MQKKKYFYEMKSSNLNVISTLFIVFILVIYIIIDSNSFVDIIINNKNNILMKLEILLFPYLILHEIVHSIAYVANGANFKNITYGIHLEKSILCCSCKQKINKKNILCSLIAPFVVLGIFTLILGLIFNLPILIILSLINISGCSGDIIMFIAFLKIKNLEFFEYDNPLAFGIVTDEDLSNKKMFGLKKIQEDNATQTISKKIVVSKVSIIFIILFYLMIFFNLLLV